MKQIVITRNCVMQHRRRAVVLWSEIREFDKPELAGQSVTRSELDYHSTTKGGHVTGKVWVGLSRVWLAHSDST